MVFLGFCSNPDRNSRHSFQVDILAREVALIGLALKAQPLSIFEKITSFFWTSLLVSTMRISFSFLHEFKTNNKVRRQANLKFISNLLGCKVTIKDRQ